jgi:exopolysaccharide production protein ExoY
MSIREAYQDEDETAGLRLVEVENDESRPLEVVVAAPPLAGGRQRSRGARAIKRTIDLVATLLLLVPALLLMLVVGVAVLISDGRPIFFRQLRAGRNGKPIHVWKFRTMVVNAEEHLTIDVDLRERYLANGHKLSKHEDPRVTRLGRFLRGTSLDELPQLFNVLAGSMSLVGPRPVPFNELARNYKDCTATVLSVRPGMTGLWQVSGRSEIRYPERAQLDAKYAEEWTVPSDIGIMFRTIEVVFRRTGAH